MRVPVARVGSSVARMLPRMMGMDFWPRVPVLADADVTGFISGQLLSETEEGYHWQQYWNTIQTVLAERAQAFEEQTNARYQNNWRGGISPAMSTSRSIGEMPAMVKEIHTTLEAEFMKIYTSHYIGLISDLT
ncbi:hypothetical protein EV421DRAFT_1732187 [Armillaria borealis]|uniref:Uncharacterized protein n=1 Tax=Armillaria borealis TaxID=47425 RepID=A0AA39MXL4_9AGAR|nr:hypothetical protein EV421DRAFT_1732187 [Armillaria borealis]